jgi:D-3-phosphoglycerate dehydrogenase / 2-oxoglutarate reductase
VKVLLTHTPEFRRQYYGERSLKGLQALAEVILHEAETTLDAAGLVAAARGVDIIVADRITEGRARFSRSFRSCALSCAARSTSATST